MKVDFTRLRTTDIEGNEQERDLSKLIGNTLFQIADNVAEHELGIKIYHSTGEMEITDEEKAILKKWVTCFKYVIQKAVLKAIEP